MSASLREILGSLLETLDHRQVLKTLDPDVQEMLDQALEKVIAGTDSKIALVPGHKRKLYKAVIKSLEYADELIEQIPQPIELSSSKLVSDPYIRAFFYTISGLQKACLQSSELREYFQQHEASESCAMLCMRKVEETILGMQLEGDRVMKDVTQTRVSFVDHRIQSPAEEESIARKELKCCIFEGLINNALEDISAHRAQRRELETQYQRLSRKLRAKTGVTTGLDLANGISSENDVIKLAHIEQELSLIGYVTPEVSLNRVNATFDHPEDFVTIKKLSINLDKSGILRSSDDQSHSVHNLKLSEVTIKGQPPRVVTLVKIKGDEIGSRELRFPQAI